MAPAGIGSHELSTGTGPTCARQSLPVGVRTYSPKTSKPCGLTSPSGLRRWQRRRRTRSSRDLDAGEIRGKEAATVYGIATDKLVKLAGWDRSENKEENFLNNLMKTLHGGGKLTVEVEPAEVIDVTPRGGDGVERAIGAARTPPPSSSAEKER